MHFMHSHYLAIIYNTGRFNTRKYIKKYFGARYFLKVLNFFLFSFYFPFLKTIEFSLFFSFKNLEKKSGVQSPESSPDFILYPMLLTKFSVASTAIEIGNLSMGENLIMVSA